MGWRCRLCARGLVLDLDAALLGLDVLFPVLGVHGARHAALLGVLAKGLVVGRELLAVVNQVDDLLVSFPGKALFARMRIPANDALARCRDEQVPLRGKGEAGFLVKPLATCLP